jgi:asparagine synthase (glutamine-hydrolysing)
VCGINGIVTKAGVRGENVLRDDVLSMNRAILHRGPDGSGCFAEDCAALGHVRLAILDLSAGGAQPMYNESSSLVLVFNGEIYNYIELREELLAKGHVFRSRSDSEVILHAFEEWGEECVKRFNGMWAFGIWNRVTQRLFISRDRLGVKPLYFKAESDSFIFSSELKGITAVRSLTKANRGKVHDYLAYGYRVNDGQTFFAEVNELPPGHNLTLENGGWSITRYWHLPERETHQPLSNNQGEERRQALHELLGNAVRLRFRSDVPVALLQSGGLDSSIIACIVNDLLAKGDLEARKVLALTAHFPGSEYDEVEVVERLLSSLPHIDLETVEISGKHLSEHLHDFIRQIGEPVASPTSFAHWSLMKELKKQGIKCVINGQGADEAFAGYIRYIIGYRLLDLLFSRPWTLPGQIISLMRRNRFSLRYILAQFFKAVAGRRAAAHVRSRVERVNDVLSQEFRKEHDGRLPDLPMAVGSDNLDKHLRRQLEYYGFNQILHYEDHSSMSQGIEIRSPFVDYRMMEFAFTLPDTDKFDHGRTKAIMRDAYKGLVPDFIVNSAVKIGFHTPSETWLTSPGMKSIFNELCHGNLKCRIIWDETKMKNMFGERTHGNFPLWRFLNVELWAREFGITNL